MRPLTRFFVYKVMEKSSIVEYVLRLSKCYNRLNQVGVDLPDKIVMVLQKSLPPSCESFVMNYNISRIDTMILERFTMFDTVKVEIKKEHQLLMVSKTTSFKEGKGKKGYFIKQQTSCSSSEETQG